MKSKDFRLRKQTNKNFVILRRLYNKFYGNKMNEKLPKPTNKFEMKQSGQSLLLCNQKSQTLTKKEFTPSKTIQVKSPKSISLPVPNLPNPRSLLKRNINSQSAKSEPEIEKKKMLEVLDDLGKLCQEQYQNWKIRQINYMQRRKRTSYPVDIDLDSPWDENAIA